MLLANLFVSLVRHVSVQHHLLLLFLVSRIPLRLFLIYQLKIGFDDLRLLLHLLVKLNLTFMLSLLVSVYIRQISPHLSDTLIMLLDSFFVLDGCLFELFILE